MAVDLSGFAHWLRSLQSPSGGDELTDAQLIAKYVQTRDEVAFRTVFYRHAPSVWKVCRWLLPNQADAEEILQQTFGVLQAKAATTTWDVSVGSWLRTVARTLAKGFIADAARRREVESDLKRAEQLLNRVEDLTLRALLKQFLAELPEELRAPVVLTYYEGLNQREVANHLGVSQSKISVALDRARDSLRQKIENCGYSSNKWFTAFLPVWAIAAFSGFHTKAIAIRRMTLTALKVCVREWLPIALMAGIGVTLKAPVSTPLIDHVIQPVALPNHADQNGRQIALVAPRPAGKAEFERTWRLAVAYRSPSAPAESGRRFPWTDEPALERAQLLCRDHLGRIAAIGPDEFSTPEPPPAGWDFDRVDEMLEFVYTGPDPRLKGSKFRYLMGGEQPGFAQLKVTRTIAGKPGPEPAAEQVVLETSKKNFNGHDFTQLRRRAAESPFVRGFADFLELRGHSPSP